VTLKAKLFRGLADPSRLGILEALRNGTQSVSAIVELTGLTQPNVSNHLGCLLDCGFVVREQRGRFAYYRVSDARVETLLAEVDAILAEVAPGVGACARYEEPCDSDIVE